MREKNIYERGILLLFIFTLALWANQLLSQTPEKPVLFPCTTGFLTAEQCHPDIITFNYCGTDKCSSVDVHIEHIDYAGRHLETRAESVLIMCDDASVLYREFLLGNDLKDAPFIRQYFEKVSAVRDQLQKAIPIQVLAEVALAIKARG